MKYSRILMALCALSVGANAYAALGGTLQSVQIDRDVLGAGYTSSTSGVLTVHTLARPEGGMVREFTDHTGLVVGVAWTGRSMPNLQQILGSQYFPRLAARNQTSGRRIVSHRMLVIEDSDLVVESRGSMHSGFTGRAYLTSALAAGITPEQFK
jgi:hypothetical protein